MSNFERKDLISDSYLSLNSRLHEDVPSYGSGNKWLRMVTNLTNFFDARSVLDYGCGKRRLESALRKFYKGKYSPAITSYDPAIPGCSAFPGPHDLLVCTDVMEHIEPEKLVHVIRHTKDVTRCAALFVISTRAAAKTLRDGRNAHLIVKDALWWRAALAADYIVIAGQVDALNEEFVALCLPRTLTAKQVLTRCKIMWRSDHLLSTVLSGMIARNQRTVDRKHLPDERARGQPDSHGPTVGVT